MHIYPQTTMTPTPRKNPKTRSQHSRPFPPQDPNKPRPRRPHTLARHVDNKLTPKPRAQRPAKHTLHGGTQPRENTQTPIHTVHALNQATRPPRNPRSKPCKHHAARNAPKTPPDGARFRARAAARPPQKQSQTTTHSLCTAGPTTSARPTRRTPDGPLIPTAPPHQRPATHRATLLLLRPKPTPAFGPRPMHDPDNF